MAASPTHLCETFRHVAASVFADYQRGRAVGLVPWETSFTDFALLKIASAHPRQVLVHRFDGRSEAVTGADWEWWFCSQQGFTGVRMQAKRMPPGRTSFPVSKSKGGVQQAELLATDAVARGAHPLYCLYSDQIPAGPVPTAPPGPCPHGPFNPHLWGAAIVHAEVVRYWLGTPPRQRRPLQGFASPWHHLVCTSTSQTADAVAHAFVTRRLFVHTWLELDGDQEAQGRGWESLAEGTGPVPDDVVRAYRASDPTLIEPDGRLEGVVLVGDVEMQDGE